MGSVSMQTLSGSPRERVSAFVDGEVPFAALGDDERAAWNEYHLIGDALRSDELALGAAANARFASGFAARFADEPVILAPAAARASLARRLGALGQRAMPSLAVAAAAAMLTWIVVPQMRGNVPGAPGVAQVASLQPSDGAMQRVALPSGGNLIRDARLDAYLEAHQQFAQQPVMPDSMPLVRNAVLSTQSQ